VYVAHPGDQWERFVWPAHEWYRVDSLIRDLQQTYGHDNVSVES